MSYISEIEPNQISLKSFTPKTELNPKFWVNGKLNSRVRLRLLDIADDFIDDLSVTWVKPSDIILTGSIANYNWSKYSDVDLHIVMDYTKVYPKNKEFVEDYFNTKKNLWLSAHENLKIYGFNVELYVEDENAENPSSGRYSLFKNKWLVEPTDFQNSIINQEYVKRKSAEILTKIDDAEDMLKHETDLYKCEMIGKKIDKLFDILKRKRSEGLKTPMKEMSSDNIIYKIVRRAGYFDKMNDIINHCYDKVYSINEGESHNEENKTKAISVGILPYRTTEDGEVEVFLGFPGQPSKPTNKIPQWMNRWNILKGHMEYGEDEIECAIREFNEESGVSPKLLNPSKMQRLGTSQIMDGWDFICYAIDMTKNNQFDKTNFHSNMVDNPSYLSQNNGKPYPEISKYNWFNIDELPNLSNYESIFVNNLKGLCDTQQPNSEKKTVILSQEQNDELKESLESEMKAYHGSASQFDEFNDSFIGSGEGNQVHGYGIYVSTDPDTGRSYANDIPKYNNKKNSSHFYEVSVPDNNGKNYLDEGEGGQLLISKIAKGLEDNGIFEKSEEGNIFKLFNSEASKWLKSLIDDKSQSGKCIYQGLSDKLRGDKSASQFLNSIGIIGIHYRGREDGECCVIFDPSNIKIVKHLSF